MFFLGSRLSNLVLLISTYDLLISTYPTYGKTLKKILSMCHLSTKNMAFVFTLFFVKQQENTWIDVSLGFEVHERFPAGRA